MPVDAQVQVLLDQLAAAGGSPLSEQSVEEARQMMKMLATIDGEPDPATVTTRTLPGPERGIPVRIYRPTSAVVGEASPILVWYHGGGWVIGDLDTAHSTASRLAERAGALVISVDYRLAPEHPFPAGLDDCWAVLQWAARNGAEIGGDMNRIAVGGDSAGGNLSAVVAQRAAREGVAALRHQLLVYPVTDCTQSKPSHERNGDGYLLTADAMKWFVDNYLGAAGDPKHPDASPLFADDLSGVCPATVITAEYDPLCDEGEAYAQRLKEAGVPTELHSFDGMIHGFFAMTSLVSRATDAMDVAVAALKSAFAEGEPSRG